MVFKSENFKFLFNLLNFPIEKGKTIIFIYMNTNIKANKKKKEYLKQIRVNSICLSKNLIFIFFQELFFFLTSVTFLFDCIG